MYWCNHYCTEKKYVYIICNVWIFYKYDKNRFTTVLMLDNVMNEYILCTSDVELCERFF